MDVDDSVIETAAIDWHLVQGELSDDGWLKFIAWLEADPRHADAYDRVARLDRVVAEARFPVFAANDDAPVVGQRGGHWRRVAGGSIAAALVAALLLPMVTGPGAMVQIATKPGEHRTIHLGDGSIAELSGDTRLRYDRATPRQIDLTQGEATLQVRHDATHPFAVTSRGVTVQDVGTVFDVLREGDRLSVAVAEGEVLVDPQREAVTLRRGDALAIRQDAGTMTRSRVDPASVGGWRNGLLSFSAEPLDRVFAAVRRSGGADVVLEGDLSHQPFTGMVRLTGMADRDVPHLARLIGATWRRDGERWILADERASH